MLASSIINSKGLYNLPFDIIKGKKLIIYGCNSESEQFCRDVNANPVLFVDDSPEITCFLGVTVLDVYDIVYMKPAEFVIAVIKPEKRRAFVYEKLSSCGLLTKTDYYIVSVVEFSSEVTRDVHLGFNRRYDRLESFEIYGNQREAEIKILALGGSTTDPQVNQSYSWPLRLFDMLTRKGIKAQVFNGGLASYTSSLELIKLIRDGILLEPDIVISYSFVNDFVYVDSNHQHNRHKHPFVSEAQEKLIRWIFSQQDAEGLFYKMDKEILFGLPNEKSAALVWVDNMRMMHGVCEEFGLEFIGLLQPNAFAWGIPDTFIQSCAENWFAALSDWYLEMYKNYLKCTEQYDEAERHIADIPYIFSLRDIFHESENIYYDNVHVFEKGNEIIAANIYSIMKASGLLSKPL